MRSLSIAAAGINLQKLAGDAHHSKDECIVKRSAKIVNRNLAEWPGGGPG